MSDILVSGWLEVAAFVAFCTWLGVRIVKRHEWWAINLAWVVAGFIAFMVVAALVIRYILPPPPWE
jgi:uncharacterized membrane protein YoaK (UPF0700 family)